MSSQFIILLIDVGGYYHVGITYGGQVIENAARSTSPIPPDFWEKLA